MDPFVLEKIIHATVDPDSPRQPQIYSLKYPVRVRVRVGSNTASNTPHLVVTLFESYFESYWNPALTLF